MVSGASILLRAGIQLMDEGFTRWTLPELCGWLNDAVKATVLAKPSACSESRVLTLIEGTHQRIDQVEGTPLALQLLGITRNLSKATPVRVGGRPVRLIERGILDTIEPYWHDPTQTRFTKEAKHYLYDENVPLEFYVYPGNLGTGMLEATVSFVPDDVVANGDVNAIASYDVPIGLPEPYSGPVLDYVLHRAFSKDDIASNAGRAQSHYAQFASAVGLKIQVERATSPNATRAT